jgi:hypothetical protein
VAIIWHFFHFVRSVMSNAHLPFACCKRDISFRHTGLLARNLMVDNVREKMLLSFFTIFVNNWFLWKNTHTRNHFKLRLQNNLVTIRICITFCDTKKLCILTIKSICISYGFKQTAIIFPYRILIGLCNRSTN